MLQPWLVGLIVTAGFAILLGAAQFYLRARMFYRRTVRRLRGAASVITVDSQEKAVIIKANRRLAANLRRYGQMRRDAETNRQFKLRLIKALPMDRKALDDFMGLAEQARYSDHAMGQAELTQAISALRAIQYSLEKVILTQEQLINLATTATELPDPAEPGIILKTAGGLVRVDISGGLPSPPPGIPTYAGLQEIADQWVIAPIPPEYENQSIVGTAKQLLATLRQETGELDPGTHLVSLPEMARPSSDMVLAMKALLQNGDYWKLGDLLVRFSRRSAGGSRVHVDPSLESYLLEFERREHEAGNFHYAPSADKKVGLLMAAAVLALSEGRDFLIPDDIKLALYCAGPVIYDLELSDVTMILDKEMRQIKLPHGPMFLLPKPVFIKGLPVPV